MSADDNDDDLWGTLPDPTSIEIPEDILERQAQMLTSKTNGLLVGELRRIEEQYGRGYGSPKASRITFAMEIRVPRIDNFTLRILDASYDIALIYPVNVTGHTIPDNEEMSCSDENVLRETLRYIFTHEETQSALRSLMAHAMDPRKRLEARLEEERAARQAKQPRSTPKGTKATTSGPDDDIPF